MKKVDLLIFRSYMGPFLMTFFVVVFLHIMQFFFVYIDDFVGKGLEWYIVAELVFYLSANTVPIALPLAVLLSSIMAFGNLGERYELTALKSAGINMLQFMRAAIIFIFVVAVGSLAFSNYAMPTANLKFYTTLLDITQQKPALNIKENVFYSEIENYILKIDKKGKDSRNIYGVYISDQSSRRANDDIMVSERGEMFMSGKNKDSRYLVLKLYDGGKYEALPPNNKDREGKYYVRTYYDEMEKVFDLSAFKMTRTKDDIYKDHYVMLNIEQLKYYIDSLDRDIDTVLKDFNNYLSPYFHILKDTTGFYASATIADTLRDTSIVPYLNQEGLEQTYSRAITFARNVANHLEHPVVMKLDMNQRYMLRAEIEMHRKYVLAAACLILLFIGGPFGAIVRLGGFGWPVLFSVIFYIFYFVLFKMGENFAQKEVLPPAWGMWLPTFVMMPFSIWLTIKAMNDSPVLVKENYVLMFKRFLEKAKPKWKRKDNA